jgi:DNA (cytosine-5)-methyltransferase 3A
MSNAIRESITKAFGFEPICINSALVSAQNRQRLYWVGKRNEDGSYSKVEIEQPVDRGILLRDILEYGTWINPTNNSKSRTIHAGMSRLEHNMIPRINHENPAKQQHDCIVEPVNVTSAGKAQCLRASCYKDGIMNMIGNNIDRRTCVAERVGFNHGVETTYVRCRGRKGLAKYEARIDYKAGTITAERVCEVAEPVISPVCVAERGRYVAGNINQHFEARDDGKTNTLTTVQKDNNIAEPVWFGNVETAFAIPSKFEGDIPVKAISASDGKEYDVYCVRNGIICVKGKEYQIKLPDCYYIIRKLTVTECRRLQTVPDWYEFPVSNSQAYKMLGNGWTCSVISHLINATLENK